MVPLLWEFLSADEITTLLAGNKTPLIAQDLTKWRDAPSETTSGASVHKGSLCGVLGRSRAAPARCGTRRATTARGWALWLYRPRPMADEFRELFPPPEPLPAPAASPHPDAN